jgi:hypothetical protein
MRHGDRRPKEKQKFKTRHGHCYNGNPGMDMAVFYIGDPPNSPEIGLILKGCYLLVLDTQF